MRISKVFIVGARRGRPEAVESGGSQESQGGSPRGCGCRGGDGSAGDRQRWRGGTRGSAGRGESVAAGGGRLIRPTAPLNAAAVASAAASHPAVASSAVVVVVVVAMSTSTAQSTPPEVPQITLDSAGESVDIAPGPSRDYHARDPSIVVDCDVCVLEDQRLFYIQ
ncbi:hypothetical protein Y032_0111g216 [Ancylostoma ceylanicum]|uniref:Uncharacterized protein n=1 Tax=Ancylostoma ceylanicum TaxID=53326 RepID=A0A016TE43_9BILA|nr:hypothetical protein Y032_0111g216 [Ancylostoma ceylanicum]